MLDLHRPALATGHDTRFDVLGYRSDFRAKRKEIRGGDSWKLERRQHFEETDPSRDALRQGEWDEALRLFEADRDEIRAAAEADNRQGHRFHRLRVIEEPLTPYMQWELHWLMLRAECGHRIRVVQAGELIVSERTGMLPELTILDDKVLYRVLYTEAGATEGALSYADPDVIRPWAAYMRAVWEAAEEMASYFDRAVAHLPPPPAA